MQTNLRDWFAATSSHVRDKVPVKREPSRKDGSLHERARRAKSISRSAERDCFFV